MTTQYEEEEVDYQKPCEMIYIMPNRDERNEHSKRCFDDSCSVISDITEDSSECEEDTDYDSIDEIDEADLEDLLRLSKKENHTRRLFSPVKTLEIPLGNLECNKRRRLNEDRELESPPSLTSNSKLEKNLEDSSPEMTAEITADAIFSLFMENMPLPDDLDKSTFTSCSSNEETIAPLGYNPHLFEELVLSSSVNAFWNTIMSMEQNR